jgi:penicillin-binding protein 1A
VFVGFDDNRSLGHGETGAVAALPIFIEFMQEAIKGLPPLEFKAPPDTKFAYVGPNREAFRPGTEPHVSAPPVAGPSGDDQPFAITPMGPEPPPDPFRPVPTIKPIKPSKLPDQLQGLY